MKDTFGATISVGDKVIYAVRNGGGTQYVYGTVSELKTETKGSGFVVDMVAVHPLRTTEAKRIFKVDPLVYASNVVVIPVEK